MRFGPTCFIMQWLPVFSASSQKGLRWSGVLRKARSSWKSRLAKTWRLPQYLIKNWKPISGPGRYTALTIIWARKWSATYRPSGLPTPSLPMSGTPGISSPCRFQRWRIWAWRQGADTMMPAAPLRIWSRNTCFRYCPSWPWRSQKK